MAFGLVRSRTPHETSCVAHSEAGAVHEPVFEDDHAPVPDPQLNW